MGHIVVTRMKRFEESLRRKRIWYFGITVKGALSSEIFCLRDVWRAVRKMVPTKKSLRTFRDLIVSRESPKITYIYIYIY